MLVEEREWVYYAYLDCGVNDPSTALVEWFFFPIKYLFLFSNLRLMLLKCQCIYDRGTLNKFHNLP